MSLLRGKRITWPGIGALVCILSACAVDPYTLPPPRAVEALSGAQSQVFRLAGNNAPEAAMPAASVCSTEAGHCPVPAGTPAGLRCLCEAPDGSYTYAGRTGDIPPMPAWADPAKKRP